MNANWFSRVRPIWTVRGDRSIGRALSDCSNRIRQRGKILDANPDRESCPDHTLGQFS